LASYWITIFTSCQGRLVLLGIISAPPSLLVVNFSNFEHCHFCTVSCTHMCILWAYCGPYTWCFYAFSFTLWIFIQDFLCYSKFLHISPSKTFLAGRAPSKNIGWALCSDDDFIISMTSLLLIFHSKIGGGLKPPPTAF